MILKKLHVQEQPHAEPELRGVEDVSLFIFENPIFILGNLHDAELFARTSYFWRAPLKVVLAMIVFGCKPFCISDT